MQPSGCAVVRHRHLIAVVGTFLMGCVVLLMVVGCAGVRSEAPQKEEQGHTEATTEESRCEGTRSFKVEGSLRTTNDVPGCPNGGLLSGTDKSDALDGLKGEDEIHGLGGSDALLGGVGNDIIYGGPGDDWVSGNTFWMNDRDQARDVLHGGEDVLYGGMATIGLTGQETGSGISSIAAKVGTTTTPTRSTTWTAVARRSIRATVLTRRSIARSSALI